MNKKIIMIFLVGCMFLVAGCVDSGTDTRQSGISQENFHGGERAIVSDFATNAPPETIRDGGEQTFSVRVELENKGEYSIEEGEGYVVLGGFSSRDLGLESSSREMPALRGVQKQSSGAIIDGGRGQVTYNGLSYQPEISSSSFTQDIHASICYPYQTESVASLCISGDTLQYYDEDTSVCDLDSKRSFGSSGGPIKIENVEQYPAGSELIEFRFDVVHKATEDSGRLFRSGSIDSQCRINGESPSSSNAAVNRDYVQFDVNTDPLPVNCNGAGSSGEIHLSNDRTTVVCTVNTQREEDYVKPISIDLSYDYYERISTELSIERTLR